MRQENSVELGLHLADSFALGTRCLSGTDANKIACLAELLPVTSVKAWTLMLGALYGGGYSSVAFMNRMLMQAATCEPLLDDMDEGAKVVLLQTICAAALLWDSSAAPGSSLVLREEVAIVFARLSQPWVDSQDPARLLFFAAGADHLVPLLPWSSSYARACLVDVLADILLYADSQHALRVHGFEACGVATFRALRRCWTLDLALLPACSLRVPRFLHRALVTPNGLIATSAMCMMQAFKALTLVGFMPLSDTSEWMYAAIQVITTGMAGSAWWHLRKKDVTTVKAMLHQLPAAP